ncbi:C4-dicarboxylate ABC transporter substrate-binding protein [Lonepinella koalarum]|uniref:Tripartite ATP-independent transporter DctP family solute receptor n=1 Tax=Lonepinella koalarum TaxID=53417 RepID=A0A4R1KQ23_9PAST|nr:TRAP transporter substrate-binding protein DctP [Lonepinella koalarum]MDH2925762.1 C4-dicarboxylate ABC transporter substrate-binding protein [Lonepinella koalarum]TCK66570.1 tripartite ATP-independent transporter DctP family solute receptor [Lonepinella koalarum]TFJ89037.1 C4-dicarboxylate ABC transporter substrate-binding protein [Lonepinella koalarum]TYG34877.1 C4-dicarboxylate ABC transporter substrate-binding protein [Lonepinella koalarum]
MKIKKSILISTFLLTIGAAQAAQYKLTVPIVTNLDSYNYQSLLVFKNIAESHSNGEISVEIYPSGQLCGNAKECLAGVQSGMFDYFQTTVPELANYWQSIESFDLPYLLPNDRVAECVYDNQDFIAEVREGILGKTQNLRLMMISNSGGWRNFATTKKVIQKPEDLKGLKLRTVPAAIQQELVKTLGGAPTPIAWPEVYTALSTGMVDGTKNGIVDIVQMKFHESLKHITLDGHAYMGGAWLMNNDKFNSLPDNLKKVILDAVIAQNQYLRSYPKWQEFNAYEEFKKAGGKIYNPTTEEKEAFKKATMPIRDNYLNKANEDGKKWLTKFEQQIHFCETKISKEDQEALK